MLIRIALVELGLVRRESRRFCKKEEEKRRER
jgi:hypothetical protein